MITLGMYNPAIFLANSIAGYKLAAMFTLLSFDSAEVQPSNGFMRLKYGVSRQTANNVDRPGGSFVSVLRKNFFGARNYFRVVRTFNFVTVSHQRRGLRLFRKYLLDGGVGLFHLKLGGYLALNGTVVSRWL